MSLALRSLLFAPANRLDLIAKLPRSRPDAVALDLEDGTPPDEKLSARAGLPDAVESLRHAAPSLVVSIRTNSPRSDLIDGDLVAGVRSGADAIIVPKVESPEDVLEVDRVLARQETTNAPPTPLIVGLESAPGVFRAADILLASPRVAAAYFGAEDYAADMGAVRTIAGMEVLYARSQVVLAARIAGVGALDQVVLAVHDDEFFLADARQARELGYGGKMCIHPRQVALAQHVFTPSPTEVERSRQLLAAYAAGLRAGQATILFEGQMVDGPLVKRAQAVLERAGIEPE